MWSKQVVNIGDSRAVVGPRPTPPILAETSTFGFGEWVRLSLLWFSSVRTERVLDHPRIGYIYIYLKRTRVAEKGRAHRYLASWTQVLVRRDAEKLTDVIGDTDVSGAPGVSAQSPRPHSGGRETGCFWIHRDRRRVSRVVVGGDRT